jgi:NADH-quinone oxidoreductase subunit J
MDPALFYIFAAMTLAGGVATITRRNPVHAAVCLIVSLLGVAGLFLLETAEFLFAVQILLYVGGVMVLFLFVVFLIQLEEAVKQRPYSRLWPVGVVAVVGMAAAMVSLGGSGALPAAPKPPVSPLGPGNTEQIADSLLTTYLLAFEAVSVLLLVAIVGAVWLARKKEAAG